MMSLSVDTSQWLKACFTAKATRNESNPSLVFCAYYCKELFCHAKPLYRRGLGLRVGVGWDDTLWLILTENVIFVICMKNRADLVILSKQSENHWFRTRKRLAWGTRVPVTRGAAVQLLGKDATFTFVHNWWTVVLNYYPLFCYRKLSALTFQLAATKLWCGDDSQKIERLLTNRCDGNTRQFVHWYVCSVALCCVLASSEVLRRRTRICCVHESFDYKHNFQCPE